MKAVGITPDEYKQIVRIVAAVLWLGNIKIISHHEKAHIKDQAGKNIRGDGF